MCLLVVFFRAVPDADLVVGANREELYARRGEPPQFFPGSIAAVGGRDSVAGGTWLGINARGVVVAVTNRGGGKVPAKPRSRGLLVRDLLTSHNAKHAVDIATKELEGGSYAGCNLFCGDSERAVVIEGAEWLRVRPLPPGVHVLANGDINDGSDERVLYTLDWLGQRDYASANDCIKALKTLCAQKGGDGPPICLDKGDRGTVSSSIIAVRRPLSKSAYWHSQGSPDRTAYDDISKIMYELALGGGG
jgi:uncharacterized protein with NRDE domain